MGCHLLLLIWGLYFSNSLWKRVNLSPSILDWYFYNYVLTFSSLALIILISIGKRRPFLIGLYYMAVEEIKEWLARRNIKVEVYYLKKKSCFPFFEGRLWIHFLWENNLMLPVVKPECLCPHSKIHMLKPNPQCDGLGEWGLGAMRPWECSLNEWAWWSPRVPSPVPAVWGPSSHQTMDCPVSRSVK